jgi:esterase/lipase superfamily enzyme
MNYKLSDFMQEEHHLFFAEHLEREFEILTFGSGGIPVLLFPTGSGRYYTAKDLGFIDVVADLVEDQKLKIYCPDSVDSMSWFNWGIDPSDRINIHNGYERVILNDVVKYIQYESGKSKITAVGIEFGAYHALNLAFRHPHLFSGVITIDGNFDIKKFIFGFYDDNSYFNNPIDFLPNLEEGWYLEHIKKLNIILGCSDYCENKNENFLLSDIFNKKLINHQFIETGISYNRLEIQKRMFREFLLKIL